MTLSRKLLLAGLAAVTVAVASTSCVIQVGGDSSLTIDNQSSHVISRVHLAEVGDPTWGPNLLPKPLLPGDQLWIDDIACGYYDVLVADGPGVTCVVGAWHLCFDDHVWVIDDWALAVCDYQ